MLYSKHSFIRASCLNSLLSLALTLALISVISKRTNFGMCPKASCERHQQVHQSTHFTVKATLGAEVAPRYHSKDLIDGALGGNGGVEDTKVALQASWNVIATTTCRIPTM